MVSISGFVTVGSRHRIVKSGRIYGWRQILSDNRYIPTIWLQVQIDSAFVTLLLNYSCLAQLAKADLAYNIQKLFEWHLWVCVSVDNMTNQETKKWVTDLLCHSVVSGTALSHRQCCVSALSALSTLLPSTDTAINILTYKHTFQVSASIMPKNI